MAGKFKLKKTPRGKFHFNLVAGNGRIVLTSETYESRAAAEKGVKSVQKNAGSDKRFERKSSKRGEPYFVLKAANGEIIGRSEMYSSNSSMEKGIASVMKNGPTAPLVEV